MRIVLLAVGLGSFFIIGVRSLQENLIAQFAVNITAESPDMFLLDIQRDQVRGGASGDCRAPGDRAPAPPRLLPVLRARVVGVEGRELNLENYEDVRGRGSLGREYTDHLSQRARTERDGSSPARSGTPTPSAEAEVSIEQFISERSRSTSATRCASTCWAASSPAKVTSVRFVEWSDSRAGGFMFVFRPGVLETGAARLHRVPAGPQRPRRARGCRARWSASRRTCR